MLRFSLQRVRNFKSLRPELFALGNSRFSTATEPSSKQRNPPVRFNIENVLFVWEENSSYGCFLKKIDLISATQQVVSQIPLTSNEEFKAAVSAAKQAFPAWRNTPVTTRQRIMFKLQQLIRRDIDKLAMNITTEQGKTLKDAHGDVFRGLEVVEHACGMATLQMGEFIPNVSSGIDTYSIREPLGVCAGICPFNFPAMIPLWVNMQNAFHQWKTEATGYYFLKDKLKIEELALTGEAKRLLYAWPLEALHYGST
ncbi:Methylmalonate-semialdehyde dehydrogenase [acylating], mitochondrial [Vitis vinifera]|uniref:Methylmalonate-semialdehyde dehydrogenase [acylating], mitochondrial n=1 Tax=Vitis vinifera TaxID=29760 RepID=A0A438CFE7_VITVI|nr:Methylmalonate-semialdehyde dehydrogenase [acylating], mitochondrial [Vitis vinifera]